MQEEQVAKEVETLDMLALKTQKHFPIRTAVLLSIVVFCGIFGYVAWKSYWPAPPQIPVLASTSTPQLQTILASSSEMVVTSAHLDQLRQNREREKVELMKKQALTSSTPTAKTVP